MWFQSTASGPAGYTVGLHIWPFPCSTLSGLFFSAQSLGEWRLQRLDRKRERVLIWPALDNTASHFLHLADVSSLFQLLEAFTDSGTSRQLLTCGFSSLGKRALSAPPSSANSREWWSTSVSVRYTLCSSADPNGKHQRWFSPWLSSSHT